MTISLGKRRITFALLRNYLYTDHFSRGVAPKVLRNDLRVQWKANPIGATFLSSKKEDEEDFGCWNTNVVSFVNGSWKEEIYPDGTI